MELKNSGLGIASLIIRGVENVIAFIPTVIWGVMELFLPYGIDAGPGESIIIGFYMTANLGILILAFLLGVAGLVQKNRNKKFAIRGTILSATTFLATFSILFLIWLSS